MRRSLIAHAVMAQYGARRPSLHAPLAYRWVKR
jgi:hypothetical protein